MTKLNFLMLQNVRKSKRSNMQVMSSAYSFVITKAYVKRNSVKLRIGRNAGPSGENVVR